MNDNGNKQVRLSPGEQRLIKMLRLYDVKPENLLKVFSRCVMAREMGTKEITIGLIEDENNFLMKVM